MTDDELRALEESLWREETRYDSRYLERVLHAEYYEFGRSGRVHTRAAILASTADGGPIQVVLPLPDFAVHRLGEDSVLVTYTSIVGETDPAHTHRSTIWIRTAGEWQARFSQGTPFTSRN